MKTIDIEGSEMTSLVLVGKSIWSTFMDVTIKCWRVKDSYEDMEQYPVALKSSITFNPRDHFLSNILYQKNMLWLTVKNNILLMKEDTIDVSVLKE